MVVDRAVIENISYDQEGDLWVHLAFPYAGTAITAYKDHLIKVFDWKDGWPHYRGDGGPVQVGDYVDVMADDVFAPDQLETVAYAGNREEEPVPLEEKRVTTETFRLGIVELPILPDQIVVRRNSTQTVLPTIRASSPIRQGKGRTHIEIEVQAIFADVHDVNSFSRGLRGIMAEFRRTPLLPVINPYLNYVHGVQAVALSDIQIETLPIMPGTIMARIVLLPFNHLAFMPHLPNFMDALNPPVLEWYLKRGLIDPKPGEGVSTNAPILKPLPEDFAHPRHHGLSIDYAEWPEDQDLYRPADEETYPDARLFHEVLDAVKELEKEASGSRRGDGWYVVKNDPGITAFHGIHYAIIVMIWGLRDGELIGTGHSYDYEFTNAPWFAQNFIETYGEPDLLLCKGGKAGPGWTDISQRVLDRVQMKIVRTRDTLSRAIEPLFKPFEFEKPEDIIITGITAGHQNIFSTLEPVSSEWPAYQFLGQKELRCKVEMEVFSEEALKSIVRLYEYSQNETRVQSSAIGTGFLWLKNPLTELLGLKYVMLDTLNVRKRPNSPGHYQVQMIFVDFDVLQVTKERTQTITKRADEYVLYEGDAPVNPEVLPPGYVARGAETVGELLRVNDLMRTISAYPDLDLPTWNELIEAFGAIPKGVPPNVGAEGNEDDDYRSGEFVDPDFYFYFDPATADGQIKNGILRRMLGEKRLRFWLADNEQRIQLNFGQDIAVDDVPIEKAFQDESPPDPEFGSGPTPKPVGDPSMLKGFVHDEIIYSGAGRMIRAFPAFSLWLVDEGRWIWWAKTWDNFYGLGAVSSIEVNRSRKRPVDSCVVVLSNIYGYLTDEDNADDPTLIIRRTEWWRQLIPEYFNLDDEQMRELRSKPRDELPVGPGARMHVRMGYGGNVSALPIVFNGTVTDFQPGSVATMTALGDGAELTHKIMADPYETSKELGHNNDPRRSIIQLLMLPADMEAERSWFKREWALLVDIVNRTPKGPVRHFGEPGRWYSPLTSYIITEGELGQNIYSAKKTKNPAPMWWEIWKVSQDNGPEVELMLHDQTVWDVIRNYQRTIPNFVAAVHPFEFRSTLFFGRPQWEIEYGYDFVPIPKDFPRREGLLLYSQVRPESNDTEGWTNYQNRYFWRPKKKPFSQWHIYSSLEDILANEIRASSQSLIHNVVATYFYDKDQLTTIMEGPNQREMFARADEKIFPHLQRWDIVNTNIYFTNDAAIETHFEAPFNAWKRWRFSDAIAFNYAASVVRESMEEMYQGYLTVIGDATVKPYDIIYLGDYYNQMYGGIGVRSVTQHLSLETGFVTNIEPDALVSNKDPERNNLWSWFGTLSLAVLSDHLLASVYGKAITSLGTRLLAPGLPNPIGSLAGKSLGTILGTAVRWATVNLRRQIGFAVGRTLMGIAGASSATLALLALPALVFAFDTVEHMLKRYFNEKDCVTMALLTYRGREYSAGILGHKESVVIRPDFSDVLRNLNASDKETWTSEPQVPSNHQEVVAVSKSLDGWSASLKSELAELRAHVEDAGLSEDQQRLAESIGEAENLVDQLPADIQAYVEARRPSQEADDARESLIQTTLRGSAVLTELIAKSYLTELRSEVREQLAVRAEELREMIALIDKSIRFPADPDPQESEPLPPLELTPGYRRIIESTLPESKRILIDAGHGGHDSGAEGFGRLEKDLNLAIALELANLLKEVGYQASLTRGDDTFISPYERADMAVQAAPDLFLSIHHNAADISSALGSEIYVPSTSRWTRTMGEVVLRNITSKLGTKSRGVKIGDKYVVIRDVVKSPRAVNTHVMLVEMLFMTNASDADIVSWPDYTTVAAEALANGIIEFFTGRKQFFDDWVLEPTLEIPADIRALAKSDISRKAISLLDIAYKPEGASPEAGFSSGSFVSYVLREARGVQLGELIKPREILESGLGRVVNDPVPDDLIFIAVGGSGPEQVNMVGLVLDPKQKLFIASVGPGSPSKVTYLRWDDPMFQDSYITFRRITWLTSGN